MSLLWSDFMADIVGCYDDSATLALLQVWAFSLGDLQGLRLLVRVSEVKLEIKGCSRDPWECM